MDAPQRGALTLIRLIGALLIVATILELGLYWAMCANPQNPQPVRVIPILLHAIPAVVGFVILLKSKAIAEWLSNILDL